MSDARWEFEQVGVGCHANVCHRMHTPVIAAVVQSAVARPTEDQVCFPAVAGLCFGLGVIVVVCCCPAVHAPVLNQLSSAPLRDAQASHLVMLP